VFRFRFLFIALAKIKSAVLLTDDSGMYHHARGVGAKSILVRETDVERIDQYLCRILEICTQGTGWLRWSRDDGEVQDHGQGGSWCSGA
jgi:hypothetical protein